MKKLHIIALNLTFASLLLASSLQAFQPSLASISSKIMSFFYKNEQFFQEPLSPWHKENWQNNGACNIGIEFLQDSQGKKFVIKYHKNSNDTLYEALGGLIGSFIDNVVNNVIIAPSNYRKKTQYATLHTHVSGKEVGSLENMRHIDIREGISNECGLHDISIHKDLAKIVAVNIFLNDHDCHNYNLFFDEIKNKFYAIDKELIFCDYGNSLANKAYNFLKTLKIEDLTIAELEALTIVKRTLYILLKHYPPQKMYKELLNIAQQNNFILSQEEKERFLTLINKNYKEVQDLYNQLKHLTQGYFIIRSSIVYPIQALVDVYYKHIL